MPGGSFRRHFPRPVPACRNCPPHGQRGKGRFPRGGTLIALAADEIVMDENAVLGPVDPQLGQEPAASILRVVEQKDKNEIDDATLIHADMAEKALSQGTWTHDYPITFEEAKEMGLQVNPAIPDEIHQLMALFPQPARQRPSVEYTPLPYRTRPAGPSRGAHSP